MVLAIAVSVNGALAPGGRISQQKIGQGHARYLAAHRHRADGIQVREEVMDHPEIVRSESDLMSSLRHAEVFHQVYLRSRMLAVSVGHAASAADTEAIAGNHKAHDLVAGG